MVHTWECTWKTKTLQLIVLVLDRDTYDEWEHVMPGIELGVSEK